MKEVFFAALMLLLIAILPSYSQVYVEYLDTQNLFPDQTVNVSYKSYVDPDGNTVYMQAFSSDTLTDTLYSRKIYQQDAYADLSFNFGVITDSTATGAPDTIASIIELGMFRGFGCPDSTGYEWKHLLITAQDTVFKVMLIDSTWWYKEPTTEFRFRIRETSANKNYYFMNFFPFKEQ